MPTERMPESSAGEMPSPSTARRHALTTRERQEIDLSAVIPGWGSDLDPAKRPGVPRDKAPELGVEHLYPPDIPQQQSRVKIHRSTEHGRLPPVFGTSCPPRGLSGRIRDAAYRLSEGRLSHWLLLALADRVNVVEGLAEDIAEGQLPNLVEEMGLRSEWRHNRAGVLRKAAIVGAGAALTALLLSRRRAQSGSE